MDPLAVAYVNYRFMTEFMQRKGSSFQDLFNTVMGMRYPQDFIKIKAWGAKGDEKNDGLLQSHKMLFQVYAPEKLIESKAISKIDEDFWGALDSWKGYFNTWVFVHNSQDGISPGTKKYLSDLESKQDTVKTASWGLEEIRSEVFKLNHEQLCILFGSLPSMNGMQNVTFEKIKIVLDVVARKTPTPDAEIRPVPKDKIEINGLSGNVETLLMAGMKKSKLVDRFFETYHDPEYGDEVAKAFNDRYIELKRLDYPPDVIFSELLDFAGGRQGDPGNMCAALAVLAHFFEECDIFEETRSVKNDTSN
ncbi:MAG: ABC-three component system protein [Candidatus Altiarchaeia archaeon]